MNEVNDGRKCMLVNSLLAPIVVPSEGERRLEWGCAGQLLEDLFLHKSLEPLGVE